MKSSHPPPTAVVLALALVAVAACAHDRSRSSFTTVTSAPASPATAWSTSGGPADPGAPAMGDTIEETPKDAGPPRR